MDPKVKEFIDSAKSKERSEFEKKRNAHLISLGLVKEQVRKYSDAYNASRFPNYDRELKKYYGDYSVPVDVTDEEYEEIKRITSPKDSNNSKIENGAENFLGVINIILLIVGIITAFVLFIISSTCYGNEATYFVIAAIVVLFMSFVSWAILRVMLNISNNLHRINSKLK